MRNSDGAAALVFRMDAGTAPGPRFRFQTDGLEYVRASEAEPRVVLAAVVERSPQPAGLFAILAADIAQHVCDGTMAGAGSRLAVRLEQWRSALKARAEGLSREAVLGLFGELLVLLALGDRTGAEPAVAAWTGPEDGLHDFEAQGVAVEVKTIAGNHSQVPISSLDQLDTRALRRLVLARVRLVDDPDGDGLSTIVNRARSRLGGGELERKLALGGWRDQDAARYEDARYRHVGTDLYEVAEAFPALTRAIAPAGVVDASYRVDVRAIQPFRLEDVALVRIAEQMMGGGHGSGS